MYVKRSILKTHDPKIITKTYFDPFDAALAPLFV